MHFLVISSSSQAGGLQLFKKPKKDLAEMAHSA